MKLIRNISWIFAANLIVSLTKWLVIVVIARFLTPTEVGAYSLALAIGAPVTLFANMKLRLLYITEEKYSFYDYVHSRNILSVLALTVLLFVAFTVYPDYLNVILLVGLAKIFDLQSDIYYAMPHKEEKMNYIGKLMTIKHIVTFCAFLLIMLTTKDLIISLLGQLFIQILFFYFIEQRNINKKYSSKSKLFIIKNIKRVILTGIPLGFVQMIVSLNSSYPRFLLESFESSAMLGYFSAIAYILTIGNMMMNSISQSFIPLLAKKLKLKKFKSFKKVVFVNLTLFSLGLGIILILFALTFGEPFLRLVYGEEYAQFADVLVMMSIALTFSFVGWTFDIALLAMRYISIQPKISIIVSFLTLIVGFIFIKEYGIYGATFTILIANIFQLILRGYFVNFKLNKLTKKETNTTIN